MFGNMYVFICYCCDAADLLRNDSSSPDSHCILSPRGPAASQILHDDGETVTDHMTKPPSIEVEVWIQLV